MNIVVDLVVTNKTTGRVSEICCFRGMSYDEKRDDLIVSSHGLVTYIKHIENYHFEFKYRVIDNRSDEYVSEESEN